MHRSQRIRRAFTLLELCVVLAIVVVLAVIAFPLISNLRARAQRAQCTANLKNLYVAANMSIQQNGSWPQIPYPSTADGAAQYANAWIAALEPFGIIRKTWICPTIQGLLNNPDYSDPTNGRIDYMAMPFDDKPGTPHKWPRQPWFVEVGDIHGNGNLMVFADGSVSDLKTVAATSGGK